LNIISEGIVVLLLLVVDMTIIIAMMAMTLKGVISITNTDKLESIKQQYPNNPEVAKAIDDDVIRLKRKGIFIVNIVCISLLLITLFAAFKKDTNTLIIIGIATFTTMLLTLFKGKQRR